MSLSILGLGELNSRKWIANTLCDNFLRAVDTMLVIHVTDSLSQTGREELVSYSQYYQSMIGVSLVR